MDTTAEVENVLHFRRNSNSFLKTSDKNTKTHLRVPGVSPDKKDMRKLVVRFESLIEQLSCNHAKGIKRGSPR